MMATELEDLVILRLAKGVADGIWKEVTQWEPFARDVLGGQLARVVDQSEWVGEPGRLEEIFVSTVAPGHQKAFS